MTLDDLARNDDLIFGAIHVPCIKPYDYGRLAVHMRRRLPVVTGHPAGLVSRQRAHMQDCTVSSNSCTVDCPLGPSQSGSPSHLWVTPSSQWMR